MIGTLFSPKGTLESSGFLIAGFILIFLGFAIVIGGPNVGINGALVSLLLAYPWVCIWMKRLRQGGVSVGMMFAYFALYGILFFVFYLLSFFLFSGDEIKTLFGQAMSQEISQQEFQVLASEAIDPNVLMRNVALSGLLASLIALFIGNAATPKSAA